MNYWLLCLPRTDLDHCIKQGTFGLRRKFILDKVKAEDKVLCCATKQDWRVIASGKAVTDYYIGDSRIFLADDLFANRFDFVARPVNPEIDLMAVIDKLSFVTNLAYWAVYFRNGIVRLSPADWELLNR